MTGVRDFFLNKPSVGASRTDAEARLTLSPVAEGQDRELGGIFLQVLPL